MSRIPVSWGAALAAAVPARGWADSGSVYDHGPHMWGDGWHVAFGPPMMILFIVVVVVAIVLAVRSGRGGGTRTGQTAAPSPSDILEQRFARGEIDVEEFAERKRHLEQ
jgi:putative membrane protein